MSSSLRRSSTKSPHIRRRRRHEVPSPPKPEKRRPLTIVNRDHLKVEVPEEMVERLAPEGEAGQPLLRLTLKGTTAGFPFLTELYQSHGVKCRIVKVWFEYDERGAQFGQMLTELQDPSSLPVAKSFLHRHGIGVETLGYLAS